MNCKRIINNIEALTLADITAGFDSGSKFKMHIETCSVCKKALQEHHVYLSKMSHIQTLEFSEGDAAVMLSKLTHSTVKPTKNDNSFLQGFIAASVLALSVFSAWNVFNYTSEQAPIIAQNNVNTAPDYFTTEVVLVINAPEDMYDADLNIVLPQQIVLEGYDNLQELNWSVDLKAGVNTLSLPIRVNKHQAIGQPLSIMAKLYHYAEEREFEIKVNIEKIQYQQKNSAYLGSVDL